MDRALQLEELKLTHSYNTFSSFIRVYDVRRWLSAGLNISDKDMTNVIAALDRLQIKVHPEKIEDVERHAKGKLRLVTGFILRKLANPYPRALAEKIFADKKSGDDGEANHFPEEKHSVRCDCAIPEKWKMLLPFPPEKISLSVMSPTRIDSYRQCPFTFYLRDKSVLGTPTDFTVTKLTSSDCGNVAHRVLEVWGNSSLKDSDDPSEISAALSRYVDDDFKAIYGEFVPSEVDIQRKSLIKKLGHFAVRQSKWRRDGWVIKAAEQKLSSQYAGILFEGKCDRIDYNEHTNEWCIIDYKTWAPNVVSDNAGENEQLPLQLPIYCAMLARQGDGEFKAASLDSIKACYALIGETLNDTYFSPFIDASSVNLSEKVTRELLSKIESGIFWPPSKRGWWKKEFARWIGLDPTQTVSQAWILDQERRVTRFKI